MSEWTEIFDRCESPIERALAEAFRRHWPNAEPATGLCSSEAVWRAETEKKRLIYCQYPVQKYRADFLIVQGYAAPLVVECDGWQYHQGDPSTWERDSARDAAMKAAGFETLRFPGSRIHGRMDDVLAIIERALKGDFR